MSAQDNGGAAFPSPNNVVVGDCISGGHQGMDLRDYFAAKAMQGFCANPAAMPQTQEHFDNLAIDALRMADAMLKARQA